MAVRFNDDSDAYSENDAAGLPTSTSFSLTCWIYQSVNTGNFADVVSFGTGSDTGLGTLGDGTSLVAFSNSTTVGSLTVSQNQWYKCGVVFDGATTTFYHAPEGSALVSDVDNTTSRDIPTTMLVGNYWDGGAFHWNGRVAAFKVWDAALTQTEIDAELAQYGPVRTTNLLRAHTFQTAPGLANPYGSDLTAGITATTTEAGPSALESNPAATLTTTLPALSADVTAATESSATLAATLPALTADLAATVDVSGTLAVTLPALSANLTVTTESSATLAATLPTLTSGLAAGITASAGLDVSLPAVTASLTSETNPGASLTATLPVLTSGLTAAADAITSLAVTLPTLASALASAVDVVIDLATVDLDCSITLTAMPDVGVDVQALDAAMTVDTLAATFSVDTLNVSYTVDTLTAALTVVDDRLDSSPLDIPTLDATLDMGN